MNQCWLFQYKVSIIYKNIIYAQKSIHLFKRVCINLFFFSSNLKESSQDQYGDD